MRRKTAETMEHRRRKRSYVPGCLGMGCGLPILGMLILWLMFSINNRPPTITVPTPRPIANNGYDDFVRAGRLAQAIKHKSPASLSSPPADTAGLLKVTAACTKDAAPALAALRQGLSKTTQAPPVRSTNAFRPQYASFRELARTILGVAMYYEMSGQPGKAAEVMLDGEEMAVLFPRGGGILEEMVGFACEGLSLSYFEKALPQLSQAELTIVADRLDRIAARRQPYVDAVREESNISTADWIEILRDPQNQSLKARFKLIRDMMPRENGQNLTWQKHWKTARYTFADKTAMLRENQAYFKALAEEARGPYVGSSRVPVPDNFIAMQSSSVDYARSRHLVWTSILDLYRLEIGLYRYRAATGRFPDALSQLTPTYLKTVPIDPFTGRAAQAYRYKTPDGGKSFLLYGLGPDMKDDAGLPVRYPNAPANGDMVAGHLGHK